jgi:hypothetical protein
MFVICQALSFLAGRVASLEIPHPGPHSGPRIGRQGEPMRRSLIESRNYHRFYWEACVLPKTLAFLTDLKLCLRLHRFLQLKCVGIPIKPFPHTFSNT